MWSTYLKAWTVWYLNENRHAIVMRKSASLWTGWSEEKVVATATFFPALYGGFVHPKLTSLRDGGRTAYFLMSMWVPYNVFVARVDLQLFA